MNERRAEFHAKIARDVREHNRSIIGVGGDGGEPPFAYTIGNATRDLPELLVLGLAANSSVLNTLSDTMLERGKRFDDGELVSLGGQFPVKIIDATSPRVKSEYTVQAGQYLGSETYDVQQVLLSDKPGKFPDEKGCARPYVDVAVLRAALQ